MKIDTQLLFQYLSPSHTLSRLSGWLANCCRPMIKNFLIKQFVRHYLVDMSSALQEDPLSYKSFNQFFTRKLKPETRPLPEELKGIACPVDGSISQIGSIQQGQLIQAKGISYDLNALLAGFTELFTLFEQGSFITLYLAPKDYHRVHIPLAGRLRQMIYVPGKLFSVKEASVNHIPKIFTRNERVIALFDTQAGPMAVIFIGAMLVASIYTSWAGLVTPRRPKKIHRWFYHDQNIFFERGASIGHFELGSTVIVLFGARQVQWLEQLESGQAVLMGEQLGCMV